MFFILDDALLKTLEEMEKNLKPLASQSEIADGYLQITKDIKVFSKLSIISVYIILH